MQAAGRQVLASSIWQDRFAKYRPRDLQSKILGFSRKAVRDCERLALGGKWAIMIDTKENGMFQFSIAYSKFLPYAFAMMQAEEAYQAFGLDFESINSQFKTCLGFNEIGYGHFPHADEQDVALFSDLAEQSFKLKVPMLPFDEAYRPACCFVFQKNPKLFKKHRTPDNPTWQHVHAVAAKAAGLL